MVSVPDSLNFNGSTGGTHNTSTTANFTQHLAINTLSSSSSAASPQQLTLPAHPLYPATEKYTSYFISGVSGGALSMTAASLVSAPDSDNTLKCADNDAQVQGESCLLLDLTA
jgi:hypothetical protein